MGKSAKAYRTPTTKAHKGNQPAPKPTSSGAIEKKKLPPKKPASKDDKKAGKAGKAGK